MLAEFLQALRRSRAGIIGWSIGLVLYSVLILILFDTITELEGIEELLQSYPPELMAFFGDITLSTTPSGYLDTWYFSYMTLILGIYSILAGAGLLASDEEKGILDLLLAYPIRRSSFIWSRIGAMMAGMAIILAIGWLSWVIPSASTQLNLTWSQFLQPFLSLYAVLLLFSALALLLSMLLPSARLAAMFSGGLLVANFLLIGLTNLNEDLQAVAKFSPLYYYQGGQAISGMVWTWFLGLLAVSLFFLLASWWLFQRRDIRVGGERSWHLSSLRGLFSRD